MSSMPETDIFRGVTVKNNYIAVVTNVECQICALQNDVLLNLIH